MITQKWLEGLEIEQSDLQLHTSGHEEDNRQQLIMATMCVRKKRLRPLAWVLRLGSMPMLEHHDLVLAHSMLLGIPIIEFVDLDPDKIFLIYGDGELEEAKKAYVLPLTNS